MFFTGRSLCQSARSATRDVERTDKFRAANVAPSRTEQCGSAARLYTVVARPTYAASAWDRITTEASDRQRTNPAPWILLAGYTNV